jgi:hypothetical protein
LTALQQLQRRRRSGRSLDPTKGQKANTPTAVQALQAWRRGGRAQAVQTDAPAAGASEDQRRMQQLKQGPVEQLREAATQELSKAESALKEASGISWTGYLSLPLYAVSKFADWRRWSPIRQMIDDGQASLKAGDQSTSEEEKRRSYAAAWTSARTAQGAVQREASSGKTGITSVVKEEAKTLGVDAQAAGKKADDVVDTVGGVVKVAVVGLTLYAGMKIVGALRG